MTGPDAASESENLRKVKDDLMGPDSARSALSNALQADARGDDSRVTHWIKIADERVSEAVEGINQLEGER